MCLRSVDGGGRGVAGADYTTDVVWVTDDAGWRKGVRLTRFSDAVVFLIPWDMPRMPPLFGLVRVWPVEWCWPTVHLAFWDIAVFMDMLQFHVSY